MNGILLMIDDFFHYGISAFLEDSCWAVHAASLPFLEYGEYLLVAHRWGMQAGI
jgi:hypothetical protein